MSPQLYAAFGGILIPSQKQHKQGRHSRRREIPDSESVLETEVTLHRLVNRWQYCNPRYKNAAKQHLKAGSYQPPATQWPFRHHGHDEGQHHDHLVCLDCGKVEEFYDAEIEKRQHAVAKSKGFTITDHALSLYATCNRENCPSRNQ